MPRIRRVRWFAITAVAVTAAATFAVGADAFAAKSDAQCQPHPASAAGPANHSWRTGGFHAAGCRAWRHMHRHAAYARTP
jgi:hypothetical protein